MKMINQSIKLLLLIGVLVGLGACSDYLDINTSPNSPEAPGDLDLLIADMTSTTSYNLVGGGNWSRLGAQWIQHIANNATAPSNDTYRINTSDMNNEWAFYSYAGVLINGKKTIEFATETEQWHHIGIAKLLMAHNYALLTDMWGDIPFTEALGRENNIKPSYDDQATVYNGIQTLLDEAIAELGKNPIITVGGGDFYFGGDPAAWIQVAYALKARYYMHLTNVKDPQAQATLALESLNKAMTGPEAEARFPYSSDPGSESPWNQWVSKFATAMQTSAHFINLLKDKNDPRLPIMADQNNNGEYVGHVNGGPTTNTLGDNSAIGQYYLDADFDFPLMTYVEQKFIEAEALWILDRQDEAKAAYETAIRTHMNQLSGNGEFGTVISTADQDAYLDANPLNSLEDLITQKYIAGYIVSSMEAYNDFRRTGFPSTLVPVPNGDVSEIPTRMIYTDTEVNNNAENVPAGITLTSKVWWDQ